MSLMIKEVQITTHRMGLSTGSEVLGGPELPPMLRVEVLGPQAEAESGRRDPRP